MEKHVFTNTDLQEIEIVKSEIDSYRGGDDFTTVYMKNGNVHYIKSTFSEVDEIFDL